MSTNKEFEVLEAGIFYLKNERSWCFKCWISRVYNKTGIKSIKDTQVGDTITTVSNPTKDPLYGYRPAQSMVFAGLYPVSTDDYEDLRSSWGSYN